MKKSAKRKAVEPAAKPVPKYQLLTLRQCRLFLNDMHEYGYTDLTIEQVERIAQQVHEGTASDTDVIAGFLKAILDDVAKRR